ncbi:class I glutamine amidotransferase-like protein [Amylocarpus encephaloides]|uniref:Class I glutamine amidotransferase-like protein n=1 Tax=Amylocarpus encephaloides TaxID=45428 RepID=A0A9P8C2G7_9HELO|nr:class I glutamine amidotransferase-like protein [Amylocarpus encephaloides]
MSDPIDLTKPHRTIQVGIILMNSKTEVLDLAPIDLLNGMTLDFIGDFPPEVMPDEIKAKAVDMEFHWVNETGETAKLTAGLNILPTDTFATCPPLDITLMGACALTYKPTDSELEFIRKSYENCTAFLNICAGMIQAQKAGILKDKTCTGPRGMLPMFKAQSPETTWLEKRYVQDGKIWTSGALLNGLEMMRAFVTQTWGSEGPGVLAQFGLELGHFPDRDVDYKDAASSI